MCEILGKRTMINSTAKHCAMSEEVVEGRGKADHTALGHFPGMLGCLMASADLVLQNSYFEEDCVLQE